MKNKIIYIVILFAMLFQLSLANAQTLDSLIYEAIRNNPKLKALQSRTRAAESRAESFNSYPAPTLGLEFSGVPFWKYNIVNDAFSNQISLSQMFMLGGKVGAMTESERRSAVVTGDNYDIYKVSLTGQIKMSYYSLWVTERKIEVQRKNLELINDLINFFSAGYQTGRGSQADIFTLKGEIASGKIQLVTLGRDLEAETYKLNKLLGRELSFAEIKTAKQIPNDTLQISLAELEERLEKVNPALRQMNNMAEMSRAMITANEKELVPDLMLQAMVMRQPQGMYLTTKTDLAMLQMEEPKTEYMYSLMASITLPFAPWSANKFKAREEELFAGIKAVEYEKSDMQRDMISQLKAAVLKYKTSQDLLRLYSGSVIPLYEQAVQAQLAAYESGRTNINVVVDSYRMLLMQRMNYYMAQADARMSLVEIEMMLGGNI